MLTIKSPMRSSIKCNQYPLYWKCYKYTKIVMYRVLLNTSASHWKLVIRFIWISKKYKTSWYWNMLSCCSIFTSLFSFFFFFCRQLFVLSILAIVFIFFNLLPLITPLISSNFVFKKQSHNLQLFCNFVMAYIRTIKENQKSKHLKVPDIAKTIVSVSESWRSCQTLIAHGMW